MQIKKSKQLYHVEVVFANGMTRTVKTMAVNRQAAERRALKFQPSAIRVKRDAT